MYSLIKNEFKISFRYLLIFSGMMILISMFSYLEYLSLQDNLDQLMELVEKFPKIMKIMFGVREDLRTPFGWYSCIYFWESMIYYAYSFYLGISCLLRDINFGTAEYLFTKPIKRSEIALGKIISSVVSLILLCLVTVIFNYFTIILPIGELEGFIFINTSFGLFLTGLIFFSVGLCISSITKNYKSAVLFGTLVYLAFYILFVLREYFKMEILSYFSPILYFDIYRVADGGFNLVFLILTNLITISSILLSVKLLRRREIF